MPLLYYWRGDNYARDLDEGVGFHLNQSSPRLHDIGVGESLWAFTRAPDGAYALACELVIAAKTRNPAGYPYGPYRVWGSLTDSRYFHAPASGVEAILRGLSPRPGPQPLGRYFQGRAAVRPLTPADHQALTAFAADLPLEPRVHGWHTPHPHWELALEQACLAGDPEVADALVQREPNGLSPARRQSLLRQVFQRNRALVEELRDRYDGRCQVCAWTLVSSTTPTPARGTISSGSAAAAPTTSRTSRCSAPTTTASSTPWTPPWTTPTAPLSWADSGSRSSSTPTCRPERGRRLKFEVRP
jgi:5-methylcytosine-specific restriction protein A